MRQTQNPASHVQIARIFRVLHHSWGPQHWWPGQSRFEVIVGAILTQNTSWTNVELAMRKLRAAGVLNIAGIREIPLSDLEDLIRSSGYFRQKAARLKSFISFLDQQHGGSLTKLFAQETGVLREELLALNGVGPETADSILLYAGQHATFVVDAYTRRIAVRHGIATESTSYEDLRKIFSQALSDLVVTPVSRYKKSSLGVSHSPSRMSLAQRSPRAQVFNEMHGLIVGVGKQYCFKRNPDCLHCPLKPFLPVQEAARR